MFRKEKWISVCFVLGPNDMVPLVMDPDKGPPHYWKFPGGHSEIADGKKQSQTAVRETFEETGLEVKNIKYLSREQSGSFPVYLFCGRTDSFTNLREFGDEGELVKLVHVDEIPFMSDFLVSHRKLLEKAGMWPEPFPTKTACHG